MEKDMKSPIKKNRSNLQTGNTLQDIVQHGIDEEIKEVLRIFKKNNIPYEMVDGFPMRTDLPESIEMICKKCGKKHDMPYDTYSELLEMCDPFEENEFLVIECVYCHKGDMLPTKYSKTKIITRKV